MKLPKWAPEILGGAIDHYEAHAEKGGIDAPQCKLLAEIWQRLLTRPEMESVWPWILETTAEFELYDRMGFFYEFAMSIERFYALPKLSEAAYALEMEEISKMAAALSARMRKFEAPVPGGDPFGFVNMPMSKWEGLSRLLIESDKLDLLPKILGQFEPITELLDMLADETKKESELQMHRLPVSRKSRELKPFLIREMVTYFKYFNNGYSPSKIATICSVALDDATIDGGLVGKYAKQVDDRFDAMPDVE